MALAEAAAAVRAGEADRAVAVGHDTPLEPETALHYHRLGLLSEDTLRPFDARRDGFVMGEGGAVLVLEDAEKAAERGARPLAKVRGFGATSDAHHLTAPHPEGVGAAGGKYSATGISMTAGRLAASAVLTASAISSGRWTYMPSAP